MKKIGLIIICLLLFPLVVKADKIGPFYQTINVNLACDYCEPEENREVTIQLFADGEAVEGKQVILNNDNEFTTKFEELVKFTEDNVEINYEVKLLKDGQYVSIPTSDIQYKKETISKWVSVAYEDLQVGHDYLLQTDNWNQEYNGFSKRVALRGDVTVKGVKPEVDYKLINGKKSYYSLTEEPPENTLWHFERVPSNDANYDTFSDYWQLTDEIGKKLTLSGYNYGDFIDFIFKYSSKDGYIESEDAEYTNKVKLIPIENKYGRFYIGSTNLWPEPNDNMHYLGLDGYNQVRAQSELEYGAQFLAYEYVENVEVENVLDVTINTQLCEAPEYFNIETEVEGNGKIEVINKALASSRITFRVSPLAGEELQEIIITTASGETIVFSQEDLEENDDGTISILVNSFVMPESDVRIKAVFSSANPQTFDRINAFEIILAISLIGLIGLAIFKK